MNVLSVTDVKKEAHYKHMIKVHWLMYLRDPVQNVSEGFFSEVLGNLLNQKLETHPVKFQV